MNKEEQWILSEKYGGCESEAFVTDCARLKSGEPLGYIIGYVPFLNCKIYLDEHPLIPRSETEFWVEKAIAEIPHSHRKNVLDLCAGSGCIGVSVLCTRPRAQVHFAEIDTHLHSTIQKNVNENGIEKHRTHIFRGSLFEGIPSEQKYDFILTNPPYIDPNLDRVEDSVKNHEPHKALYGGEDGIELIEHIIKEAPKHLTPSGQIWIEHEPEQSKYIAKIARKNSCDCTTQKDQYEIERYSILVLQ